MNLINTIILDKLNINIFNIINISRSSFYKVIKQYFKYLRIVINLVLSYLIEYTINYSLILLTFQYI